MRGLGELEATVMERVWAAPKPVTVRAVFAELAAGRSIAYTTVMTVLDKLHRKGWLDREMVNRAYVYTPVRSREDYSAALMREVLSDSRNAPATLLAFSEQLTPAEVAELRAALGETPAPTPATAPARKRGKR